MGQRIGFVSTRFAGTDGVSLESAKWVRVLEEMGHEVAWYSGLSDRPEGQSRIVEEAFFGHPEIAALHERLFGTRRRSPEDTERIFTLAAHLKGTLHRFVEDFGVEVLVVQNAVTIPMHLPLGIAVTHLIAETELATIAHHHDFYWERPRFLVNAVGDLLPMAFPPTLPTVQHVTINSSAQQNLSSRRGVSSTVIPNVLDFDSPPPPADEVSRGFRRAAGAGAGDIVLLQPTRVVPRKGIEHSITLASRLRDLPVRLVVSHESGDEGDEYLQALLEMAAQHDVELHLVNASVGEERVVDAEGRVLFGLQDAYSQSDLITFPSLYEGFGNALVEAFYFRKPVLVNRYSIFITDIEPRGFRVVTMNGYVTSNVVDSVRRLLEDDGWREEVVEYNFERGRAFYSLGVLRRKLEVLLANATGA